MLKSRKDKQKRDNRHKKKKKKKTQGQTASDTIREKHRNKTIYMMHEQYQYMMYALMQWEKFNYTLKITKLAWT